MDTGKGIAIAGIWISAALSCFAIGPLGLIVFIIAMFTTPEIIKGK